MKKAKKKIKAGAEKTEAEAKKAGGELKKAGKKSADEIKKVGHEKKKSFGLRNPNPEFPPSNTLITEINCSLWSLN